MDAKQIVGTDVIGTQCEGLDLRELRYMVGLADGENLQELAGATGARVDELPFIEASIRGKLGARSKIHMLTRAFTLGVLQSRALLAFVLLAALALGLSGLLYYKTLNVPSEQHFGAAMRYDIMAGGGAGAAVADPHYVEMVVRKAHSS